MKPNEFGEYLKWLRKSKKLTIRQLDLYSGVSHSYISQVERGVRGIPSPDILQKLAKPLGVDYKELMEKAGYIEDNEALKILDKILYRIAEVVNIDQKALKELGYELDMPMLSLKELLDTMSLEDKVGVLMAATDNLENIIETGGSNDKDQNEIKRGFDLEDDNFANEINLTYKGMELSKGEKIEFLSIARAIFDARRGIQEK